MTPRITKLGHACVRIEHDGHVVVVDPGAWTGPDAVDGATAVLVTHEHADHLSVDHLRRTDAPVWTIGAVARAVQQQDPGLAERVRVLGPGDTVDVGVPATAVGERHAVIHEDLPVFDNSGFLLEVGDLTLFHPGDAFTVPEQRVDVLLLPVHAPWSSTAEVADFARAVGAPRSVAVHDGLLNDTGLGLVDRVVGGLLEARSLGYERLTPGTDLAL